MRESEQIKDIIREIGLSESVWKIGENACEGLKERFAEIDRIAEYNQAKVLKAFRDCRVGEAHFAPTTGYGYDDIGRDTLEKLYAEVFHTEDALVRPQLISGTHALTVALFGNLRPGDEILSPDGKPYDTLDEVIGIIPCAGSLAEFGVSYRQVDLKPDGTFDYEKIREAVNPKTKLVEIQRSRGYASRPSFSTEEIGKLIAFLKTVKPDLICLVDNCYGEFTETSEPSDRGADLVAGSLIKNPGGGLAPIGGYIAGKKKYVEMAAYRLTAPGLGKEIGASLGITKSFYQGLFLAPSVTASALKGAVFASRIYSDMGFQTDPLPEDKRHDITQSITLKSREAVIAFCCGIQEASPVDSFVTPEPWDMPGYDSEVIMAAGTFVSGSSIELSADGPMKEPYNVYFQGGLTWPHAKIGILMSLQKLLDDSVIKA